MDLKTGGDDCPVNPFNFAIEFAARRELRIPARTSARILTAKIFAKLRVHRAFAVNKPR